MPSKLRSAFKKVQALVARVYPELANVKLRRCDEADREHAASTRQYAHCQHHPGVICYAKAMNRLGLNWQVGILAHEFGHLIAAITLGRDHGEEMAQILGSAATGLRVEYRGPKRLEWADL